MAKNELFSIINKDHASQQSKELIASLLIWWSNTHHEINQKAKTNSYRTISLRDYLFWGKTVVHSTVFSVQQFEKIRNYKNFIISFNHVKIHIILTRPQKIIKAGSIVDQGRGILFPLHSKNTFCTQILEKFHDVYCGKDVSYPINKMLAEQLYHPHMKVKLTAFNKQCPNSCIQRALTLDDKFKMYAPGGLGGSFQFSLVKEIPLRTSSILVDMTGAYEVFCDTKTCVTKVWILLILNPATQFLELEILDDASSASIVSALIRYMSHHGSKNIWALIFCH